MSTRVPRSVVIGGVRYIVERPTRKELGGPADIKYEKARIRVARDVAEEAAAAFYRHELGHGAFYESGAYTILKRYTTAPDELEEVLVDTFVPVLCGALGVK